MSHRHRSSLSRRLALLSLPLLLAACATPPEPAPTMAMPTAYAQPGVDWRPAPAPGQAGAWWHVFADAELDRLEAEVGSHNQSLAAQLAAYDQALAAIGQAQANLSPTFKLDAGASRGNTSNTSTGGGSVANGVTAQVVPSWAPDLWGAVRLQVQQSQASARSSEALLRNTRLSLQSTLATSYLQLRVLDARIAQAQANVDADRRALQLTESRLHAGVVTPADVASARTQLLQAQTTLTDLGVSRAQTQDAIAVLVGQPASGFQLAVVDILPQIPGIPAGLPSQLLLRRPDLQSSRAAVDAANAGVGVSERAWFPQLTLGATASSSAAHVSQLFSAPTLAWSLGPQLALTVLDGGARSAALDLSRAQYRQSVANYRQSVLVALQQVEDNLAAQRLLALEAAQQNDVVDAAGLTLRLNENQYKAGVAPYLNVLNAQTVLASARDNALQLQLRRYQAAVGLIQAIGGDWGAPAQAQAAR